MKVRIELGRHVGEKRIFLDDVDISRWTQAIEVMPIHPSTLPRLTITLLPDETIIEGDALLELQRRSVKELSVMSEEGDDATE